MTGRQLIRDISVKAILAGAATDLIATNIAIIPILAPLYMDPEFAAASSGDSTAAITEAFANSPSLYLTGLLVGSACSVLDGWVAARMAKRGEIVNGAISASACVFFGIYALITQPGEIPLWQHAAFAILSPALGAAGAMIRMRQVAAAKQVLDTAVPSASVDSSRRQLSGVDRPIYVVNRVCLTFSFLTFLLFGMITIGAQSPAESNIARGGLILTLFAAFTAILCMAAANAMVKKDRWHWIYHSLAFLFTIVPIALIVIGIALSS